MSYIKKSKRGSSMCNYDNVANFFIHKANESGSYISNLKLQKLVYYAQAWHLAIHKRPLFLEDFEAWIHGPVIPALYRKYKHFSYHPISKKNVGITIPQSKISFMNEIVCVFFNYDAIILEIMTHKELPWIEARVGLRDDENGHNIISKETMKRFYGKKLQK
jgi:uncharacterized phage-associated protein